MHMHTHTDEPRRRGRPPGRIVDREADRRRLYQAALVLIAERGYDAATLREVGSRTGVSPAALYRYFPSKRAVALALYEDLSDRFAAAATALPPGKWRERFMAALELSLGVLTPHRIVLRAVAPVLVGNPEEGVFAERTMFSRIRVQGVFERAVAEATDAPAPALAAALGRVCYLAHLAVVLWWLLDRSHAQRATTALIALVQRTLPSAALALRLRAGRALVLAADALFAEALLDDGAHEAAL
jgi:AcrR family transcriptional regulator